MSRLVNRMLDNTYKRSLAKSEAGLREAKEEHATIVKWQEIYGVTQIPWSLENDFLIHRSPSYLRNTKQVFEAYYKTLFGQEKNPKKVLVPTDEHFYRCLTHTGSSFYMDPTDKPGNYTIDMTRLMDVAIFPGCYFEVRGFEIDTNTKEIVIITRNYTSIKKGDPLYEQAKIHAMTCLSFFFPGIGHSWVHFQYPCVISAIVFNDVPRDSLLYKILYVHTRFTMRINHQALRIQKSTDNKNSWLKRFNAIQAFPMTAETFVKNNQSRTVDFYKEEGEFSAPPDLNEQLPFPRFVGMYYRAIRQFIEDLGDRLEMDLLEKVFTEADKYIPADLSGFNRKDLLAEFIWQVSVLHSSDHYTFCNLFSHYACPTIRHKLAAGEPDKPEDMFDKLQIAKFEHFLDVFVRFSYDETFQNNLANLTYNFADPELQAIEKRFVDQLKTIESNLEKEGLGFAPLKQMAQSICF